MFFYFFIFQFKFESTSNSSLIRFFCLNDRFPVEPNRSVYQWEPIELGF
jgi:hypothetical protein